MYVLTQNSNFVNMDHVISIYTDSVKHIFSIYADMINGEKILLGEYRDRDKMEMTQQIIETGIQENKNLIKVKRDFKNMNDRKECL